MHNLPDTARPLHRSWLIIALLILSLAPWTGVHAADSRPDADMATAPGPIAAAPSGQHTFILPVTADAEVNTHDKTKNLGAEDEMKVLADAGGAHYHRPLFRYDLASILPGSTILSATAHFYVTEKDANPVTVHPVTARWEESTVTWNSFNEGFLPAASGSFVPAAYNQFYSAEITALVQNWMTGAQRNRGLALIPSVEKRDSKYATREDPGLERHSYLEVVVDNPAIHTYADGFDPAGGYAGSAGSEAWTGAWQEIGESDGSAAGEIQTMTSSKCVSGACLKLGKVNGSLTGRGIQRQVDLGAAVAASLAFSYAREDANAVVHVEASGNGGGAWARLDTISLESADGGHGHKSYDITPYIAVNTMIRFIAEQTGGTNDKGLFLDDVTVAYLDASALDSGIGDRVWDDRNRDGVQDVGEPGIAAVEVALYAGKCGDAEAPAFRTTRTNAAGEYLFPLLYAGNYCLAVNAGTLPADYAPTAGQAPLDVTLANSEIVADADFGYTTAFAPDRLTVTAYAPCQDIAWLQQHATDHAAALLVQDYEACSFTLGADAAAMPGLQAAVAGDANTRESEADVYVSAAQVAWPDDPAYNDPFIVYGPQQMNAPAAWAVTTGDPDLIVAIVDTGVDLTHPEFAGRLLPGWDFVNNDGEPADDNGHGTHVAGIAAAAINNNLGIAGIAGTVKILPVKVLDSSKQGWWSMIADGVTWAADQGARVINLSLGGITDSVALRNAVSYAVSKGAIVVVAAGNNDSAALIYPASYSNVLALSATTDDGVRWALASYGPNVDASAPGATIYSTYPGGYRFMSGTSMAAPHGVGLAALLLSVNPNLTPAEIKGIILDTANDMGDPFMTGAGLIDAGAALAAIAPQLYAPPVTNTEAVLVNDLSANETIDPGDTVRYLITIANNDATPINNVVVNSTVPANTTYMAGTTSLNGIPTQDQTTGTPFPLDEGGLNIGTAPANGSTVVSFDVVVNLPEPAFYSLFNETAIQVGASSLVVTSTVSVGGTACTLALRNVAGAAITSLRIGDELDLLVSDADQNTRTVTLQQISVTVANPSTGDSEEVILTETDADTGLFSGRIQLSRALGQAANDGYLNVTAAGQAANVSYTDPDFAPDQCLGVLSTLAPGVADLQVSQAVSDSTPDEAQAVVYTLKIKNNGTDVATSIVISDAVPNGLNFVTGAATHGEFDHETGRWLAGRLLAGAEATLLIDAEISGESGSTINNVALVEAVDQTDVVPGNDSASVAVTVNPADLQVTKSVNVSAPDEGQTVRYTVNVKNDGPASMATGIVISDVLPAGLSFAAASADQGSYDSATGLWTIGNLADGAGVSLLLDTTYTGGFSGRPITNTAAVLSFGQADHTPANDAASAIITPKTADLRVTKTVDDAGPVEGQTIVYVVKVKNQGPAAVAASIVISDALPAGLTFVSATAQQGSYSSATGLWTVGNVPDGVEVALTLNATVNSGTSGQRITNRAAVVSFDQLDPLPANDIATKDIIVGPADLQVTQTVSDNTPDEGQEIQYTVSVKNNGPSFATGIVISDVLPAALTFVSVNEDVGVYNATTGLWTLNTTLNSGITKKMVIKARPKAGTSGQTLTTRAEVASVNQMDDDPSNNFSAVDVTVNTVDLLITKTVSDNTPDEEQVIDYTVSIKNNGPSFASGIVISDVLPTGLIYVSDNPDVGDYDPATGLWTLGANLNSGITKKVVIKAKPAPGTSGQTRVNRAELFAVDQVDTNAGNDSANVSVNVNGVDLTLSIGVDANDPGENQPIVFTVGVKNNGPAALATGIVVSDALPSGLTFVSASAQQGSYDPATHLWTVGSLASGVTRNLSITAYVPNGTYGQTFTYQAQLIAVDQFETNAAGNTRTKAITVAGTDLLVTKTIKNNVLSPFQLAEYTVQVTHNGPAANIATGVVIHDVLPAGVIFDSANPDQGAYDPATGLWNVGSLASGVTKNLVLKAVVQPMNPAIPTVVNTAAFYSLDQHEITTNNNRAAVSFTYEDADIEVTQKVNDKDPDEGETIVFTLEVKNYGPASNARVRIATVLPAGLTFAGAVADQGSYDPVTGVWTIAALKVWNPTNPVRVFLTISAVVNAGTNGLALTNTAASLPAQPDPVPANDSASVVVNVRAPDVQLSKTVNDTRPDEGQTIIYTVKAKNNGPAAMNATNVVISDTLPAGLTLISALPEQGSYNSATGVWTLASIAKGVTYDLVISATVNAGTSGRTITNAATLLRYDQRDPNIANNIASAVIQVGIADLRVTKAVNDEAPDEGQVIRYTVNVRNQGPALATNVVISDRLPTGLTFSAYTKSQGVYDKNTGLWTVGTLAAGANANLYLDAKVNTGVSGQAIVNTAAVHSLTQADLVAANNSASAAIVVQKADIQVTKTVNDAAPDEGEVIVYTVKVKNAGPSYAADVVLEDILPAGVTYVGHTVTHGIYDHETGLWVVGDLLKDATATLTVQVAVNRGTSSQAIANTATLRNVEQNDPNAANNTATATINVRTADLRITKTVNDATPNEGQAIAYTVKVKNLGPAAATNIQVADVLPPGLTFASAAPTQGSYDLQTGLWTVGELKSGVEKALVINVTVAAGTGASAITNRAGVFAVDQADQIATNNQASSIVVVNGADLDLAQTVNDATPAEGQTITYTLTLRNRGPLAAANIVITDRLPAGVTYLADNGGGTYNPATGAWTIASLNNGASKTLTIRASVDAGTRDRVITNRAEIGASSQPDALSDNNYAEARIAIGDADLNISFGVDDTSPNVGDAVVFTVRVENRGPDLASGVKVNLALPPGLRYTAHSSTVGDYCPGISTWSVGSLSQPGLDAGAAGAPPPLASTATLTLTAVVEAGTASQALAVTASLGDADQNDPVADNNQAATTLAVHGADLALTQTVNNRYPDVGEAVVYTITLSNSGPDTATAVQVTDYWPGRVLFGSASASAGSYDSATGRWTVPSLSASTAATLRLSGVLTAGVESTIANIAEITAADQPDGDSTPANHAASEDDYAEVALFTGVPPVVDGKLDIVYSLSPDVQRVCYTSGDLLFGVWHVLPRPTENAIYTALVIDKEFVDNTYGVNAVGWPSGHSFTQLVGSDHVQFIGYDANGAEVTHFKLDYISPGFATPSGYAAAGVIAGDAASVLAANTSLAYNLNNLGYCAGGDCAILGTNLVVDSPATDAFYTPNPAYPDWIYDVIYEAKIDVAAFGPAGFGSLVVPYIHASPSKSATGNTIVALPGVCPGEIGDTVWHDRDVDGLQDDGEVGLDGVSVSLYRDNGDSVFVQASDTLIGTKTTEAGGRYLFQDVLPGGYFMDVLNCSVPAGYSLNTANDPTGLITLAAEQSYRDADFGYASLDFGDAPAPYPTLHASDGAHHIVDGATFLGAGVDNDADGQPGPTALGDAQADGNDDEDGVVFSDLQQGQWTSLDVTASRPGRLSAWIDYAADGDWSDAGDHVIADYPLVAGVNRIYLLVPFDAAVGTTYGRFRFSTVSGLSFTGEAPNGEVEDYRIEIEAPVGGAAGPGSIGDFVWHDQDGDSIQDPGEPGISGARITMTDRAGRVLSATTGLTGRYALSNLPAGTYTVTLDAASIPATYNFITTPSQYVIDLTAGEDYFSADFGLQTEATVIGDYLWYDADADGVQDVGEPGIANVTLELYFDNGDGVFKPESAGLTGDYHVTSTVSDAAGVYALRAFKAGTYFVDVTDHNGLLAGMNRTNGPQSLAEPSPPITIALGDVHHDADFGYVLQPAPAIIGDLVWVDGNRNGVREITEPVLIGVEVCAAPVGGGDAICDVTDISGRYLLQTPAGDYSVAPTAAPAGLTASTGVPHRISIADGQQYLDADFGYYGGLAALGGTVWQDIAVNDAVDGLYNPSTEPGIPGVSVNVIKDNDDDHAWDEGEPILTTFSNTGGDYLFDSLLPGDYLVQVSDTLAVLRCFRPSVPGANPGSDFNNQRQPYAVNLSLNETDTTSDFGYRPCEGWGLSAPSDPGVIGDRLWFDVDGDGVYMADHGDQPIAGVTLALHQDGVPWATATTGGYGQYLFTDLPLGHEYTVEVTDAFGVLTGLLATARGPHPGADNNNQARPYTIFLGLQADNRTADFGFTRPAAVGDFVFFDANYDGVQQEGETFGLSNIPITLINQATGQSATTTSADGAYVFTGLLPGAYTVQAPLTHSGWRLTSQSTISMTLLAGQTELSADFGYITPTAVDLIGFTAERGAAGVRVSWRISQAPDTAPDFVVWRAEAAAGPYKAVSGSVSATDADTLAYTWLDEAADPATAYWYKLEVVGAGIFYGPINVTASADGAIRLHLPLILR